MPAIRNWTFNFHTNAAGTSVDGILPVYEQNDLLLALLSADSGTQTWSCTGWAVLFNDALGPAALWKIAGASETAPTFNYTSGETANVHLLAIQDVDTTTPFNGTGGGGTGYILANQSPVKASLPSLTTTVNNSLIIHGSRTEGAEPVCISLGAPLQEHAAFGAAHGQSFGWAFMPTAGATSGEYYKPNGALWAKTYTIGISPPSGGATVIPPYCAADASTFVNPVWGTTGWNGDTAWATTITTNVGTTLNGETLANGAVNAIVGGAVNPFAVVAQLTGPTAKEWKGGSLVLAAGNKPDVTGKNVLLHIKPDSPKAYQTLDGINTDGVKGVSFGMYSTAATAGKMWHVHGNGTKWDSSTHLPVVINNLNTSGLLETDGTFNPASVASFSLAISGFSVAPVFHLDSIWVLDTVTVGGGSVATPITAGSLGKVCGSGKGRLSALSQGSGQVLLLQPVQVGDGGTNPVYAVLSRSAIEFPQIYSPADGQVFYCSADNVAGITYYAGANDTIRHTSAVISSDSPFHWKIHPSASTLATWAFNGLAIIGSGELVFQSGIDFSGMSFTNCTGFTLNGATLPGCGFTDSPQSCASPAAAESYTDSTFTSSGTGYGITITGTAANITLDGMTFTGYAATDGSTGNEAIFVNIATGSMDITIAGGGSTPSIRTAGCTVNVIAPVVKRGLDFNDVVAGSTVKIFETGTQTVVATPTTPDWKWEEEVAGSRVLDYTILKNGYIPIRVTGVTVTGAESGGVQVIPVQQVASNAYAASSGLTYGTTATVNTGTKRFGLTVASTGQNWYSFMLESWNAQSVLANVAFPLIENGPNSFFLTADWEWDGAPSIAYLSRDGMRYVTTAGALAAQWAAILSVGVTAGMQVRYQQADGTGTTNAAVTGNMDQLVQVYGDATHGNYDKRGWMVLKVQEDGYDQAEFDAVATYGNLEDQLYVAALTPLANGVATGDPALTITITDHGASPVTWHGKAFSITITDNATPSTGANIMRELRYNTDAGGTYQGKDGFNWHDLVQVNGSNFKTVRGKLYGDTGATLKGVRVVMNDGTTEHPDFDLFTADDGTTWSPPVVIYQSVTVNNLVAGSRVQLFDYGVANTEIYNAIVGGTSFTWTDSVEAASDRDIRIRITNVATVTAYEMVEANIGTCGTTALTAGVSYLAAQSLDATYNTNALDGSTVTGITINDATDRMQISIAGGSVSWASIYAYQVYWLNTEAGIRDDFAFIESPDIANYILTGFKIKNTHATAPLKITGGYGVDSVTGEPDAIYDTTGTSIFPFPAHVVSKVVTVGGVNIITGDIADIPAAPSAAANATAVRTELTTELGLLADMAALDGAVAGTDLVVTPTSRVAGSVSQTISEVGTTVTVSRA